MSTENRGRREQHRERRSLGEKFQQWRQQRREWIAGMTRGQRIRHRLLQAAVVLAIAIIAVWAVMSAWIRVPKVPDPPTAGPDTTQQPGEGEDIQFTGAELPNVAKSGRKEGYYTFLVVGRDVASGLTDTILLFTFDTNNKSLNAISLPRDTMINTSAKGGSLIRHRLLQAAVVLAIAIIAVWAVMSAWIRVPKVPDPPTAGPDTTQQPGEGEDIQFTGAELPNVAKSGRKEGYYTFLVVGRDVASGLTDTILLFTFDTNNKSLNAISLPRDTMINTSAKGGSLKRINVVYNRNRGSSDLPEAQRVENGMTALKQEVSRLTGIYPDFYVMVEWEAIGELVDALGGVYFDVPFDMNYDDPYQDLHIHQEAGYRKLSGEDAMEVIRWRKNNGEPSPGDVGRIQIQQDFLSAVLDKCLQPATLLKAPALAQVFLNNVTTDLTVGNILAFAQLAIGMDPESDVKFSTMPYTGVMYDRASLVLPVEKELLEILNSGMNPYVDQIQSSDLQLMYKKSGGGYGVTTGTLLDSSMAYAGSSSSSSGTQTTQETEEPETEQPGETDAGTETPGTTPPEGTETGTGEPGSTGSETGEPGTQGPEGETPDTDDPGAVQPEGPGQGEGAGASQPEQDPGGGNGGASQSEPSQPGTEGESGGSDLPPEWLLPDVA